MKTYHIQLASGFSGFWPDFTRAASGSITAVRPESSAHHPRITFRSLHDDEFLFLHFDVKDRYVRSVSAEPQASVCGDSCAEAFLKPFADRGYFNFEMNAGGNLLLTYIEEPARIPGGFKKFRRVEPGWLSQVILESSLPRIVDPEITEPLTWQIACRIPFALLSNYTGRDVRENKIWRGNFYKCGDHTSHPHWIAWSPVPKLNFHDPNSFGEIVLE